MEQRVFHWRKGIMGEGWLMENRPTFDPFKYAAHDAVEHPSDDWYANFGANADEMMANGTRWYVRVDTQQVENPVEKLADGLFRRLTDIGSGWDVPHCEAVPLSSAVESMWDKAKRLTRDRVVTYCGMYTKPDVAAIEKRLTGLLQWQRFGYHTAVARFGENRQHAVLAMCNSIDAQAVEYTNYADIDDTLILCFDERTLKHTVEHIKHPRYSRT